MHPAALYRLKPFGWRHNEAAPCPEAGFLGVQVVFTARIARVITGIEGEIRLAPVSGDGGDGVFDEVRRMCPFREADGSVEQAYGLEQREQPLVPEPPCPGNGHIRAGREEGGKDDGAERRQPVAHVRADTDNVSLSRFSLRMLYIDAVTEVSRFRPGAHHVAGQVKATDDGFFLVENIHISS